jgi:hypothetical protein
MSKKNLPGSIDPETPRFSLELVIAWVAATATAALTMAAYAFSTFETKEHFKEFKNDTKDTLTRIESKLDRALKPGP